MRILFVHISADLYGSSRSLFYLAKQLATDGHTVRVILAEQGPLVQELKQAGIDSETLQNLPVLHRSYLKSPRGIWRLLRGCVSFVQDFKQIVLHFDPDLIHTNTATILPIPAWIAHRLRIPHITHIRESFEEYKALWPLYRRVLYKLSNRLLCISKWTAGQFPEEMSEKLDLIYNGISEEEIYPLKSDVVEAFRHFWAPQSDLLIGLPGRIKIRRKGQDVLIRAAAQCAKSHPSVSFLIIGSPFPGNEDHERKLEELAKELHVEDRVIFCGQQNDNNLVFNALDIVIMASGTPEPFGRVTVEAMLLGKPVIGTNVGGTPELLGEDHPLLIPPEDPEAMAHAIRTLLEDPAKRIQEGIRGQERFHRLFTFERFYHNVMHVYNEVCSETKR